MRLRQRGLACLLMVAALACSPRVVPAPSAPGAGVDAATAREFDRRTAQYVDLRNRLARSVEAGAVGNSTARTDPSPQALADLIAQARSGAKQGDIFGDMQAVVRGVLRRLLAGPDGASIRDSLMDENPATAVVVINRRYPDVLPLSTMPPGVLKALPPLPEGLEYHLVGRRVILLDTTVRTVLDIIDDVIR